MKTIAATCTMLGLLILMAPGALAEGETFALESEPFFVGESASYAFEASSFQDAAGEVSESTLRGRIEVELVYGEPGGERLYRVHLAEARAFSPEMEEGVSLPIPEDFPAYIELAVSFDGRPHHLFIGDAVRALVDELLAQEARKDQDPIRARIQASTVRFAAQAYVFLIETVAAQAFEESEPDMPLYVEHEEGWSESSTEDGLLGYSAEETTLEEIAEGPGGVKTARIVSTADSHFGGPLSKYLRVDQMARSEVEVAEDGTLFSLAAYSEQEIWIGIGPKPMRVTQEASFTLSRILED